MICKYVFGKPVETGAVVMEIPESAQKLEVMHLTKVDAGVQLSCQMDDEDVVYGLGEQMRGMNKRGFTYVSDALDDAVHTEDRHSLYGSHNFLILSRKTQPSFGVFVDDPGRVAFDVGETKLNQMVITAGPDCTVYFIEGESLKDIAKQFRRLIGRSYIAPKWAFGYQQSRWGYVNESDVREVVRRHQEQGILLDAVYLDIDYMDNYKDFTVDADKFPDFPGFVNEMKDQGVHLVPIIDAGVKIEEGYPIYEEGVAGGYFCKDEDGEDFVGAVWPGKVHFPDVLNSKARQWFGGKYRWLMEQGIDGFWNDMNEPAIFYSEKNMQKVMDELLALKGKNIDLHGFFHMRDILLGLSNNPEDYKSFYHDMDGVKIRHDKVHNIYGYNMTKAAAEAFDEIAPDKRTLLFSRSSYIGMHRYGGIWTGDNSSWWSHLLLSVQQMPALNMCGILYVGSDIGGFGSDTTEDLLLRWLQFGVFTPLMRNHATLGTRQQEVYQFENVEDFRNMIRIRYGLLPYIYSEYMKAALDDELYFRPLSFDYPEDDHAAKVEDQVMVGESIMAAPVYTQNATGRYVYLPEDMLLVRMKSMENKTCEPMEKGHHYVDVALNELVFFVKKDHALPLAVLDEKIKSTANMEDVSYEWICHGDGPVEYVLYDDDGISKKYVPQKDWKKVIVDK
ncbi:MAG: alpha-glucosidase [Lachnospiraceae bacterium]|nr:alpha-glucosidase [Lachnospiraceae bacterium]